MTLWLAMLLDAIFGEPRWLWSRAPHPAVLMGRGVGLLDSLLNKGNTRKLRGIASLSILIVSALSIGGVLHALPGTWAEVILGAILLAQRSLVEHVAAVASGLRTSVEDGRQAVSMIVSRDTSTMDESSVVRSALESAAENFSDGVIAPLFWFALAGLPGLLVYKIVNTADSMIGYQNDKYRQFGWASARFDDLLNYIPARLTAFLIWGAGGFRGSWADIARDAGLHRSPNAGWPEAAFSRVLDIALAGPRSYDGEMRRFPYVNATGRKHLSPNDVDSGTRLLWRVWALAFGIALLIWLL